MREEIFAGQYFDYNFNKKDLQRVLDIENYVNDKAPEILAWFKLDTLPDRKNCVIYDDKAEYIEYVTPHLMREHGEGYNENVIADTFDGNLNMLSLDLLGDHPAIHNTQAYLKMAVHELVHLCQQYAGPEFDKKYSWFWEGLATNLSGQDWYRVTKITNTVSQIEADEVNAGEVGYTLVNFMLRTLSNEEMLLCVKNPDCIDLNKLILAANGLEDEAEQHILFDDVKILEK